jgi:hypothetical protein
MPDECPVCSEELEDDATAALPGCRHRFHVACIMNFCKYDARCPMCRQVPTGVVVTPPPTFDISFALNLQNDATDARQRAWQRYRVRRRRLLNRNAEMGSMFAKLQEVRNDIETHHVASRRRFSEQCRHVWRTDAELIEHRHAVTCLRRRELRLERRLTEALRVQLGEDEP